MTRNVPEGTGAARPNRSSAAVPDEPGFAGIVRVARVAEDGRGKRTIRRRTSYVRRPGYDGVRDNDIRGFLDGRWRCAWNQATQSHVRIGRAGTGPFAATRQGRNPVMGEHEVFRTLFRWEGIELPPGARVTDCRLVLSVEHAPDLPLRVLLYAVHRDWNPGAGGEHRNNVSVPGPGEVWWGDAACGERAWGLPGAGFAARGHPEADTDAVPLADAHRRPGEHRIRFRSRRLTAYAARRIGAGRPLLLLVKLADVQEDVPGTLTELYSAEYGDDGSVARRPRLRLTWEQECDDPVVEERLRLEYGRTLELPRVDTGPGARWHLQAARAPGAGGHRLEVREGQGEDAGPWRPAPPVLRAGGEWFEVRLRAVARPAELGAPVGLRLRDTWVVTGAPETRDVRWTFVSPFGECREVPATYAGDWTWTAEFRPDALGPWRWRWSHDLTPHHRHGPWARLDVVADGTDGVLRGLEELARRIRALDRPTPARLDPLRLRFYALERAALRATDPERWRSGEGERLRAALDEVRSPLWGKPVPREIPMQSMPLRHEWRGRRFRDPIPMDRDVLREPPTPRERARRAWNGFRRSRVAAALRTVLRKLGRTGGETERKKR